MLDILGASEKGENAVQVSSLTAYRVNLRITYGCPPLDDSSVFRNRISVLLRILVFYSSLLASRWLSNAQDGVLVAL